MEPHRLEVADVFRKHGAEYLEAYAPSASLEHKLVLRSLARCRTAALGGHKIRYSCGHEEISYNSCHDRHCPKCQGEARKKWLDARAADLLRVGYFHVVFTLPDELGPIALQNRRQVYGLLFRAVSETLLTIARDPKHLGAEIGFLAVLHTWGQNLHIHPHVHCVVPGGGISPDGSRWISSRKRFFLPVRVLSRLFRKKFLNFLREAQARGKIHFHGKLAYLSDPESWKVFLQSINKRDWVVYSKPPFGGPTQVLKYLARYTHRVAISNQRLVSLQDGKVTFEWKDYAHGNTRREMTITAVEFIRRFLQHVLPKGFMHIRHYGLLANRGRKKKLALARQLLGEHGQDDTNVETPSGQDALEAPTREASALCPICRKGRLVSCEDFAPERQSTRSGAPHLTFDTS